MPARQLVIMYQKTVYVLLLAAGGGLLGTAIILLGSYSTSKSQDFVNQAEFIVWLFFTIVLTTLLVLLIGPLWKSLKPLKNYYDRHKLDMFLSTITSLFLFLVPVLINHYLFNIEPNPLAYIEIRAGVLLTLVFVSVLPAAIGIWLIRYAVRATFNGVDSATEEKDQISLIKKLVHHREQSLRYLTALGAIIGLATLTYGANRYARIATGTVTAEEFPTLVVLAYGLYFTVVVAIIYAPTYLALLETGRKVRDSVYPIDSLEGLIEVESKRKELEALLQLRISAEQGLRTGLAILAPLLSGIFLSLLDPGS